MEFTIEVKIDKKLYRMQVTPLGEMNGKDRYRVKGGKREVIMENDRPSSKNHGRPVPIIWEIEGGQKIRYDQNIYEVGRAIEKYMREHEYWN
ncbi:MAG: hypothetical protein QM802_19805 [Agriterribacter sp.]